MTTFLAYSSHFCVDAMQETMRIPWQKHDGFSSQKSRISAVSIQELPCRLAYGWKFEDDGYIPNGTSALPAPESVLLRLNCKRRKKVPPKIGM